MNKGKIVGIVLLIMLSLSALTVVPAYSDAGHDDENNSSPENIQLSFTPRSSISTSSMGNANHTTLVATLVDSKGNVSDVDGETINFVISSGNSATLQSISEDKHNHEHGGSQANEQNQGPGHDGDGHNENIGAVTKNGTAKVQVKATSNTGKSTITAQSENFSINKSIDITTTGPVTELKMEAHETIATVGHSVGIGITFRDTQDRVVPINDTVFLSTDLGMIPSTVNIDPGHGGAVHAHASLNSSQPGTAKVNAVADQLDLTDEIDIEFREPEDMVNLSISATDGTPGGQSTISVTADHVSGITIEGIPDSFTMANQNSTGIYTTSDADNDGKNESIGWAWPEIGTYNSSITFKIDSNTPTDQYIFTITAKNGDEVSTNVSVTVTESIIDLYDTDKNSQIDSDEVKEAIKCFLFSGQSCVGDKLTSNEVKEIIKAFLF